MRGLHGQDGRRGREKGNGVSGVGDDGWEIHPERPTTRRDLAEGLWGGQQPGDEVAAAVETSGRDRAREVRKGPTMEPTESTEDGGAMSAVEALDSWSALHNESFPCSADIKCPGNTRQHSANEPIALQ